MSKNLKIAVTPGEPAGIGPDLIIMLSQQHWEAQLVIYADAYMLQERAKLLGIELDIVPYEEDSTYIQRPGQLIVKHIPVKVPVIAGKLDSENGHYVVETLRQACDENISGKFDAVVTGP
ncbi:MAG: 4-hydroxythreonine-4-phosphate dehydrogenase, partial [Glaciecola sp.]